jgi:glycerol-3-phosphate dehydrogenase subunit B
MRALELDCDNLIIGGGLAGLIAAIRLPGSTILLSGGLGATAVSSGVFHPAGSDPEAEGWFLRTMAGSYVRGRCMTISGASRTGLVPASAACEGAPALITINDDRPGFGRIDFMEGRSFQEIAHILDNDDSAVEGLIKALSHVKENSMLMPPVLGIDRAADIRDKVCKSLGADVHEYATAPSILGLRLIRSLRKKAAAVESLQMLETVRAGRIVDGRVEGVMGTKGKRNISVHGDNLFIATGGLMTGFTIEGDRLFEPLTGATVSRDFEADLDEHFFSEHLLMFKGIEPEPYIHGFDNVRAIGAASCGYGLYKALKSGYHAGDGLE